MKTGLKSLPNNLDLRQYLVVAYLKTGDEDLALEQMKKILEKRQKDVTLLLQMATLQERAGKQDETNIVGVLIGMSRLAFGPFGYGGSVAYNALEVGDIAEPRNSTGLYGWVSWQPCPKIKVKLFFQLWIYHPLANQETIKVDR